MGMDVGGGGGKKGRSTPAMNVTPLVDVVLVLLIIFMVVTPMLSKQFWIHLPDKPEEDAEPAPPPPPGEGPIVVSVNADGEIQINRDVVTDEEFEEKLRGFLAARRTRKVFFDGHNESEFGRAVQVLDMARGSGATSIAVLTEPLPASRTE